MPDKCSNMLLAARDRLQQRQRTGGPLRAKFTDVSPAQRFAEPFPVFFSVGRAAEFVIPQQAQRPDLFSAILAAHELITRILIVLGEIISNKLHNSMLT
jgi:hypothetical protein